MTTTRTNRDAAGTPIVAVVGPTATGKSDLALDLAQRLDGEIVGADAMQLYRGMDIGTAKIPVDQRRGITHHQIDVLDLREEASVAAYQRHARADIAGIRARHRVPVVVGGTGLYVRAVLDRLDIPPTDPQVRARLHAEADTHGIEPLARRLAYLDPEAARRIEPRNVRRIVRALEVIELTGRPFTASLPAGEFVAPAVMIGLTVPRPILDERIARRVEAMWEHGLLAEVRALAGAGLRDGRTARAAIGYAQALAHLDGILPRAEAIEATIVATRRYARRQESWYRSDTRVTWLDATASDLLDRAWTTILDNPDRRGTMPS